MLINFRFKNFRSFRDEQNLSLAASPYGSDMRNSFALSLQNESHRLLKSVVLMGPNASGKSSVIRAMHFMANLVKDSATRMQAESPIDVEPFLLDANSSEKPSLFETSFVAEGVLYRYGFEVTRKQVEKEWLFAFPHGREQTWFFRKTGSPIRFPPRNLKGARKEIENLTRPNSLFLSVGAQFNHEQLTVVYRWFVDKIRSLVLAEDPFGPEGYTAAQLADSPTLKPLLQRYLRLADLGITNVDAEIKTIKPEDVLGPDTPPKDKEEMLKVLGTEGRKMVRAIFTHSAGDHTVQFGFPQESDGTRKMFGLLGPWYDVLQNGRILFVDELSASLHTLLAKELICIFNSETENSKTAQLVFTTHDTALLDQDVLRRDQIWLTEKHSDGASSLVALLQYRPRKDEALQRGYLAGRYGAIPILEGFGT